MDGLGSHDGDRGRGETEFSADVAADVQSGTYHHTDHSEESTLKTEAMETDETHRTWSPSPSESKVECENDHVKPESHCLICYKNVKPSSPCLEELDHFTNPSSWQLLKVFCKHMGVQVPSDDEAEVDGIFCEKCDDTVRLLGRLDAELESVQKMISKLILGCTVAVMESPRIVWQPDCEILGRVREDTFNRYCPQISLRDCCKEEDKVPIDNDDAASFASYMVPDVDMGTDEGNNGDDDVIGLTDDEEHEVPSKVKAVKRKVLMVDAAQALPQQLQHPSTSSKKKKKGTTNRKKKIIRKVRTQPPVKRVFKEKPVLPPPTRELRDRGKISKTDDEVVVLDGPSSSMSVPAPKHIDIQEAKPEEIEPGKYLYLKKFNFAKVDDDDKFQCSSCDALPVDSVEDMVSHIQLTHVSQQPPKRRRAKRKRGYSFYIHKIRIDFDGSNYLCSLCPHKKRLRNLMKMHISFKHYLPFLKLKRAGKVEGTLGEQPEDLANKDENAAANSEEPKGSPRFEYIEDDEVSESEPEDPMSEGEDFIPEEIIREKMLKEKAENAKLKLIEPGKYLYRNEYELEKTEDGTYICLLCKDRKRSRELLLSHIRRIHVNRKDSNKVKARIVDIGNDEFLYGDKVKITKFENQYSCGECGFLSEKLGLLRGHIRNQHLRPPTIEPEPVMCEDCGKMLMGNTALRLHRDRMHTEGEKSFVCTICGKGFVKEKFLKHHMRGHNKDRPKNFVCEHCGKAFNSRQKLLSHVTTHTGETPFECDHCGQKFKQYNVMTVHRKACRTSTGQAPAAQAIAPAECVVAEYQQPQQFPAPQNIAPHGPPIPFEFFPALYGSGRE